MSEVAIEGATSGQPGGFQPIHLAESGWLPSDSAAPATVAQFIQENAFLAELLVEIRAKVSEMFGAATQIRLDLLDDPEFLGQPKLYAVILTPLAAEAALALQARLDDDWWLDNLDRAQGKLNLCVEYV